MRRLRKKLEDDPIETVRVVGYRFKKAAELQK
ncbi:MULTISPECIES: winged helix-turn-helix domain-containing protein [Clostridium]|uniref:OmpR/PhoB-type domain-containing protein n=1 Tax=Clostridium porci TaxID=2605778 RepID=A0A7X2NM81_9CLOT|nr:hypothetical protein [Clostridium porci]